MSQFVNPTNFQCIYPHPVDHGRPLFFLIDPVHLLKSIRNNWINQKNHKKCMHFPSFDGMTDAQNFHTAAFNSLRKLYECEMNGLIKYGNLTLVKKIDL